jgi:GTP-binding protein
VEAIKSIERAAVAVLVLDAQEGAADQDARIGGLIHAKGKGGIIVVNKWDLLEKEVSATEYTEGVREKLWFLDYAPVIVTSATTGHGVDRILQIAEKVLAQQETKIPTPELNHWLEGVVTSHPPPLCRKRPVKLSYLTQVSTHPPTFAIFTNHPAGVQIAYRRYLSNQLRERFGFFGNPIRLLFRRK